MRMLFRGQMEVGHDNGATTEAAVHQPGDGYSPKLVQAFIPKPIPTHQPTRDISP